MSSKLYHIYPCQQCRRYNFIQVVIKKQDEQLEQVLGTIENIKGQTLLIGDELNEQAKYRVHSCQWS